MLGSLIIVLPVNPSVTAGHVQLPADDCAICLSPLSNNRTVVVNACRHLFHYRCNVHWLRLQGKPIKEMSCAICRTNPLPLRMVNDDNRPRPLVLSGIVKACTSGNLAGVEELLSKTPVLARLSYWSEISNTMFPLIVFAARQGHMRIVDCLLAHGANIDATSTFGVSCLSMAIIHNHFKLAETLVTRGASVNLSDSSSGYTPLHWACIKENVEIVTILIRNGAEVNKKNRAGHTPMDKINLMQSLPDSELRRVMLSAGALTGKTPHTCHS